MTDARTDISRLFRHQLAKQNPNHLRPMLPSCSTLGCTNLGELTAQVFRRTFASKEFPP
jgi:hypothetical protein